MKTDNIYIAQLAYSTNIETEGTAWDYYFGKGIRKHVSYDTIKYVIVKKVNGLESKKAIDLETKKKYMFEVPTSTGVLFIPPKRAVAFDAIYPDEKRNLSKKKILILGKQAIKEFEKLENEQKKK